MHVFKILNYTDVKMHPFLGHYSWKSLAPPIKKPDQALGSWQLWRLRVQSLYLRFHTIVLKASAASFKDTHKTSTCSSYTLDTDWSVYTSVLLAFAYIDTQVQFEMLFVLGPYPRALRGYSRFSAWGAKLVSRLQSTFSSLLCYLTSPSYSEKLILSLLHLFLIKAKSCLNSVISVYCFMNYFKFMFDLGASFKQILDNTREMYTSQSTNGSEILNLG